jgi:hypothetical protein
MSTFVIVPVRDQWEHTRMLLHSLDADEVEDVLILDNGSVDETAQRIRQWQGATRGRFAELYPLGSKIHRHAMPDASIYEMWNAGFARARRLAAGEPFSVLVTNNDVVLPRGALRCLRMALATTAGAWVSYPDYDAPWTDDVREVQPTVRFTSGVLSQGGMFGACFMLAGHLIPWEKLVTDTGYLWWFGDNHLAECIELAGGRQARCVGLPVQHINEATARHNPWTDTAKYHDYAYWNSRHQRWREEAE